MQNEAVWEGTEVSQDGSEESRDDLYFKPGKVNICKLFKQVEEKLLDRESSHDVTRWD